MGKVGVVYLSETGEDYVDSQGSDSCCLHQGVVAVGEPQKNCDAHHLCLVLNTRTNPNDTQNINRGAL